MRRWGAEGPLLLGGVQSLWLKIGATVQKEFGVSILLHLTCHLPKVRAHSRWEQHTSRSDRWGCGC